MFDYGNFGVDGCVRFRGKFSHPWFATDEARHKTMNEYSERDICLRAMNGVIFQFSFDTAFHKKKMLLITSTQGDTYRVLLNKPDLEESMAHILELGSPYSSKRSTQSFCLRT